MAAASGQGSVKVASSQVYALHPKRPLTRLSRDCAAAALCPRERAVLATLTPQRTALSGGLSVSYIFRWTLRLELNQ